MADNTILNAGSGGDYVRDVERSIGSGVKTQVTQLDFGGASGNAEQLVTATNPLPVSVNAANFIFSSANSTTTNLAAGATFTGTLETALNQPSISLDFASDQPAVITVYQYIDVSGLVPVPPIRFNVQGGAGFSGSFVLNGNYVKVSVQNLGIATSTVLNLNTAYGTIPASDGYGNAPTAIYGSGDLAGVSLLEESFKGNLSLSAAIANTELRDINGARIPSDAPIAQRLIASTAGQVFTIDTQGYSTVSISMGTMAATLTGVNDLAAGTTPGAVSAYPVVLSTPTSTLAAATSYVIPCVTRYLRITVTTAGWATYYLRALPMPASYANSSTNLTQYIGTALSSTNPVHVTPLALAATNNQTLGGIIVASTTPAATVIKASAGRLTMLDLFNPSTAAAYFHIYNAASVTMGTTASIHSFGVPASGHRSVILPDGGLYCSTGICGAWTNLPATTDNTALTASGQTTNYAFI